MFVDILKYFHSSALMIGPSMIPLINQHNRYYRENFNLTFAAKSWRQYQPSKNQAECYWCESRVNCFIESIVVVVQSNTDDRRQQAQHREDVSASLLLLWQFAVLEFCENIPETNSERIARVAVVKQKVHRVSTFDYFRDSKKSIQELVNGRLFKETYDTPWWK